MPARPSPVRNTRKATVNFGCLDALFDEHTTDNASFRIRLDSPLMIFITREASSNSDALRANVTQIRLLIGRSN
jgi:hypothetical protein